MIDETGHPKSWGQTAQPPFSQRPLAPADVIARAITGRIPDARPMMTYTRATQELILEVTVPTRTVEGHLSLDRPDANDAMMALTDDLVKSARQDAIRGYGLEDYVKAATAELERKLATARADTIQEVRDALAFTLSDPGDRLTVADTLKALEAKS